MGSLMSNSERTLLAARAGVSRGSRKLSRRDDVSAGGGGSCGNGQVTGAIGQKESSTRRSEIGVQVEIETEIEVEVKVDKSYIAMMSSSGGTLLAA